MRRTLLPAVTLSAALCVGLAACGSSGTKTSSSTSNGSGSSPTTATSATTSGSAATTSVVIGSANFAENEILAEIYAVALQKAGVHVTTKLNIGSREVYFKEVENGALTVFPEYTGSILQYLNPQAKQSAPGAVFAALQKALPKSLEALPYSSAQDSDSVTVLQSYANKYHLKTIGDLAKIQSHVTFGGPPEFRSRWEGMIGLRKLYGLTKMKFTPLDEAGPISIKALSQGKVQAADIFTTDPSVKKYHFVALQDTKHLFPAQNVVPILNKKVATPTVTKVLNAVSQALNTQNLITLNTAVEIDNAKLATVAQQFVSQANIP